MSAASSSCGHPCVACHSEVRQPEQHRQTDPRPGPRRAQVVPDLRGQGDADDDRREQERDQVLVQQPEPGEQPDQQPPAGRVPGQGPQHDVDDRDPEQGVDRGRRQDVPEGHDDHAGPRRDGREHLRRRSARPAPGRSGRPARRPPAAASALGRCSATSEPGREQVRRARDQRGQRRLVGVAPREVPTGGDEVELVAVRAVAPGQRDEHREQHTRGGEHPGLANGPRPGVRRDAGRRRRRPPGERSETVGRSGRSRVRLSLMISAPIPTLTLPGGQIPVVGLGTWQSEGGAAERAVSAALQLGYRHIDTATGVRQRGGGRPRARPRSGIDRDDVFVTTKLPPDHAGRARRTLTESLAALGTDHLDLWLIHWPPGRQASPRRGRCSARCATRVSSVRSASPTTRSRSSTSSSPPPVRHRR